MTTCHALPAASYMSRFLQLHKRCIPQRCCWRMCRLRVGEQLGIQQRRGSGHHHSSSRLRPAGWHRHRLRCHPLLHHLHALPGWWVYARKLHPFITT